jgi:putative ABC transport system permease protein
MGKRKVAVIGPEVRAALFGDTDPVGQHIEIENVTYSVVGIYQDDGAAAERSKIYVPITTAQLLYGGGDRVHNVMLTLGSPSVEESEQIAEKARHILGERHQVARDDRRAIQVTNNLVRYRKVMDTLSWIRAFIWAVGAATLASGIVGVSNIVLISVRERSREFAIRKAIGATPRSIAHSIIAEALCITSIAGGLGLSAGILGTELVRRHLPENDFIRNPQLDLGAVSSAALLIVAAGILAGLAPAWNAARLRPALALR